MSEHKRQSIIQNVRWLAGSNLAVKPLWFLFLMFSTRLLGPEEFGKAMYAMSYVVVLTYVFEGGVDMFAMRELSAHPGRVTELFGKTTLLKVLSGMMLAITVVASFGVVSLSDEQRVLILLGVVQMLFQATMLHFRYVFRALEVMQYEGQSILLEKISIVALCGIALLVGPTALNFMIGFVAAYGIACVRTLFLVRRVIGISFRPYNFHVLWDEILRPALPFALMGVFTIIYYRSATLILERVTGDDTSIGYYNAGYRLVEAFLLLPTIIVMPLYASFVRSDSKHERTKELISNAVRILLVGSVLVSAPILMFHDEFTAIVFGPAFAPASTSIGVVVLTMVPVGMTWVFGNLASATGRLPKFNVGIGILTVLNIGTNWVLITRYGVIGAAVTTFATECAMAVYAAWVVRDYFEFRGVAGIGVRVLVPAIVAVGVSSLHVVTGKVPLQVGIFLTVLLGGLFLTDVVRAHDLKRLIGN